MVKFCPECAHPIIEPDKPFCPKCGTPLPGSPAEAKSPAAEPAAPRDASDTVYIPPVTSDSSSPKVSSPASQDQTSVPSPQKKSSGTWVVICCGGAIGIVVLSALVFIPYAALVNSHTISEPVICEGGVPAIGGDKCCPEGYPYIWDDGKCHSGLQGTSSSGSPSPTSCNAGYHIYSTSQGHCCKAGYPYYFDESCHECAQGQKLAINYIAQCCPNHFPYYYDGACWTLPEGTKGSASAGSPSSGSTSGSSGSSGSSSGSASGSLKSPGSACTATSECISGYGCLYGICQKWNPTPAGSYEVYCTDCQGKYSGITINEHPYSLFECKGFYVNCECMHCGTRRISTDCVYELTSGFCNYWQG
jgi:hypothetical protein